MNVIFNVLDYSAIGCYLFLAALFAYHLMNCWHRSAPVPAPAIATARATANLPATLPVSKIAPATFVTPEPTPIAAAVTAPTAKHRRRASPSKGFGKQQPVKA